MKPELKYAIQHSVNHLAASNQFCKIKTILTQFSWAKKKIELSDIYSLIMDYEVVHQVQGFNEIYHALRMSSTILSKDKDQLASQLLGRIGDRDSIAISRLLSNKSQLSGLLPLKQSLISPKGSLRRVLVGGGAGISCISVSPSNKYIASGDHGEPYFVRIWDRQTGQMISSFRGHTSRITSIIFSKNSNYIVSGSEDKTIHAWRINSETLIHATKDDTGAICFVGFGEKNELITVSTSGCVKSRNLYTGDINTITRIATQIKEVKTESKNRFWVTLDKRQNLEIWDLDVWSKPSKKRIKGRFINFILYEDKILALKSTMDSFFVVFIEITDGTIEKEVEFLGPDLLTYWREDTGTKIISGDLDTIDIYKLDELDKDPHIRLQGHSDIISDALIDSDNRYLITSSYDDTIRFWDLHQALIHYLRTVIVSAQYLSIMRAPTRSR